MTMTANGLAKLVEECGELTQVAAKKMACPDKEQALVAARRIFGLKGGRAVTTPRPCLPSR